MKKLEILLFVVLFAVSCDISKQAVKNKEDRKLTEQTETITYRKGDTVTYEVPKVIYRDTTIVKTNYVTGTTQVVRYNKEGQIDLVECISGAVKEIQKSNRELIEAIKEKEKEKEENFDSSIFLWGFIGLGLLIVIVGGAFLFYIKKFVRPI